MINPRLTECDAFSGLLGDIDCKLTELAKVFYNNIILMLNKPTQEDVMIDLLNYKRIVTYRINNPDYASDFTDSMIISQVKKLKYK